MPSLSWEEGEDENTDQGEGEGEGERVLDFDRDNRGRGGGEGGEGGVGVVEEFIHKRTCYDVSPTRFRVVSWQNCSAWSGRTYANPPALDLVLIVILTVEEEEVEEERLSS